MKTYLAHWDDGSISIVTAKHERELFLILDTESSPDNAKIYEIPTKEFCHISTYVKSFKNGNTQIKIHSHEYKLKRFKMNQDIVMV